MSEGLLCFIILFFCVVSGGVHAFPSLLDGGVHRHHRHYAIHSETAPRLRLEGVEQLRGGALVVENHRQRTARQASAKFRNFEEMLTSCEDKPVLVTFHASNCGPCRLMRRELRVVSNKCGSDVKMFAVDTDKWPKLAARYRVKGLPTIVIFKRGKILHRIEKVQKAEDVITLLRS